MAQSKIQQVVDTIALRGRQASRVLQDSSPGKINRALIGMAKLLEKHAEELKRENNRDVAAGKKKGLSTAMVDRLTLTDKTIGTMVHGLKEVAALESPLGTQYDRRIRPNGLEIFKVKVPIGVIAIIYESRPNVTVDAAAICLKSQNGVILRGGSEAFHSNMALTKLFSKALDEAGLPAEAIQLVPTVDREAIELLLKKENEIDLVIPRGGEGLIRMVVEKSHIPVIKHYKGVCHVYVSSKADMEKAVSIAVNAKVQRPGVCNAMETLLLDRKLSEKNRKGIIEALLSKNVVLFGDPATRKLSGKIAKATEADWYAEYLDLRLAVKTVDNLDSAIDHINTFGSHHTDAIVTESVQEANRFTARVDSSSVMINASTRFSDGGEYGMGCEIGISTDKLHSRGPMGVDDLTTYKWVVIGNGQVRT